MELLFPGNAIRGSPGEFQLSEQRSNNSSLNLFRLQRVPSRREGRHLVPGHDPVLQGEAREDFLHPIREALQA